MAREPKEKPIQRCPKGSLFLLSESSSPGGRGMWFARVPAEHDIDDILSPNYFGLHIHQKGLQPGDIIDIEPESALWWVQVRVMAVLPSIQQIKLREHVRQSYAVKAPTGFAFEWKGKNAKWVIRRGELEIEAGFDSQDEALARVEELQHEKAA